MKINIYKIIILVFLLVIAGVHIFNIREGLTPSQQDNRINQNTQLTNALIQQIESRANNQRQQDRDQDNRLANAQQIASDALNKVNNQGGRDADQENRIANAQKIAGDALNKVNGQGGRDDKQENNINQVDQRVSQTQDGVRKFAKDAVDYINGIASVSKQSAEDSRKAAEYARKTAENSKPGEIGPDGPRGPQGFQGISGEQGPIGLIGLTGPTGPRGRRGFQGISGEQGPQGLDGTPGKNGALGAPGPPGQPGDKGDPGNNGKDGTNGKDGVNGKDGTNGTNGKDGKDGDRGPTGPSGPQSKLKGKQIYNFIDRIFNKPANIYKYCLGGKLHCNSGQLVDLKDSSYKGGKTYNAFCDDKSEPICAQNFFSEIKYDINENFNYNVAGINHVFTLDNGFSPSYKTPDAPFIYDQSLNMIEFYHEGLYLDNVDICKFLGSANRSNYCTK